MLPLLLAMLLLLVQLTALLLYTAAAAAAAAAIAAAVPFQHSLLQIQLLDCCVCNNQHTIARDVLPEPSSIIQQVLPYVDWV
jgi:hypothetical protein